MDQRSAVSITALADACIHLGLEIAKAAAPSLLCKVHRHIGPAEQFLDLRLATGGDRHPYARTHEHRDSRVTEIERLLQDSNEPARQASRGIDHVDCVLIE
jgi:hypothetical protein